MPVNWNVLSWALTCTTIPDSMAQTVEMVRFVTYSWLSHFEYQNRLHRFLDAELFLIARLTVFSIWFVDFGTTSWFVPQSNSTFSIIPCACSRSDIYLVWIHFQAFPTVLHCTLGAVFDQFPAYVNVFPIVLDLFTNM